MHSKSFPRFGPICRCINIGIGLSTACTSVHQNSFLFYPYVTFYVANHMDYYANILSYEICKILRINKSLSIFLEISMHPEKPPQKP